MRKTVSVIQKCFTCDKEFKVYPSDAKRGGRRNCSKSCYSKDMKQREWPSFWRTALKEEKLIRIKELYENNVIRNEVGCWEWKSVPSKQYGSIFYGKYKSLGAHQASWMIHHGDIPEGMWVLHHCDSRRCSRPDHLFLGTPKDNAHDMQNKGRKYLSKGEKNTQSKLKEEQVIEIKKQLNLDNSRKKLLELSKEYGVHYATLYDIKNNKTWKHVIINSSPSD